MKRKRWRWKLLAMLSVVAVILGISYYLLSTYSVSTVYVEGNLHYTEEEIKEIVMGGPLGNNSLYLSLRNKYGKAISIPFVDVVEVTVLEPDTIRITVYEKALAGYVEFMDSYMYFDRDGYVVECSSVKTVGVPQITGLKFDYMVLGEKLPIEEPKVFENIMKITNLLQNDSLQEKGPLIVDKIHFQTDYKIVLYFGDVKVALGQGKNLEDKIMILPTYLDMAEGKRGTIRMENYTEESKGALFEFEKEE